MIRLQYKSVNIFFSATNYGNTIYRKLHKILRIYKSRPLHVSATLVSLYALKMLDIRTHFNNTVARIYAISKIINFSKHVRLQFCFNVKSCIRNGFNFIKKTNCLSETTRHFTKRKKNMYVCRVQSFNILKQWMS